jgi:hypothetical protein
LEVHQEIMQYLNVNDLLSFSKANVYVREILLALPATDIEDLTHEFCTWYYDNHSNHWWNRRDDWDVLDILERDHQDLLKAADLIPCYGCFECQPSADFGDWAIKRLTEINGDGIPLKGCCKTFPSHFHMIFHALVAREAAGRMVRTPERMVDGCERSYLDVALHVLESK